MLLLLVALVLLWLAVTDKLSRVLDAWDVLTGKTGDATTTAASVVNTAVTTLSLPSLPKIGSNAQVPAV